MTTESKSQFAKRIQRAPSYITELISHGRIVLTEDGKKVEVEQSLARLEETASLARQGVAAFHEAQRAKKSKSKPADDPQQLPLEEKPKRGRKTKVVAATDDHGRQHYERIYQAAKNNLKQLDFDLSYGRRFALSDARKEAQAIGNTLRASLERFIDTLAPRIAVTGDKTMRKHLIESEILQVKRVIKQEFPRALRRIKRK